MGIDGKTEKEIEINNNPGLDKTIYGQPTVLRFPKFFVDNNQNVAEMGRPKRSWTGIIRKEKNVKKSNEHDIAQIERNVQTSDIVERRSKPIYKNKYGKLTRGCRCKGPWFLCKYFLDRNLNMWIFKPRNTNQLYYPR